MANVGVRVERFVRLGRVGREWQVHSKFTWSDYTQMLGKLRPVSINNLSKI
jgi:hypothetical protein